MLPNSSLTPLAEAAFCTKAQSLVLLRFTVAHFEHLKNCHHGSTNLCQTVVILRKDMAGKETHCCRSLDGVSEDLTD